MIPTTNTITNFTNHQLLNIKSIKKIKKLCCVLGHIPSGFIGSNKPPIIVDQLPVETHRLHLQFPLKPILFTL